MSTACCFMCGATFGSPKNLNEHLKHVHDKDNVPTKKCDLCDYVGNAKYLSKHKKALHGTKINCDMCEKSFFDKPTLRRPGTCLTKLDFLLSKMDVKSCSTLILSMRITCTWKNKN